MSRHSNDLRERAIAFFKSGNNKLKTSRIFKISRQTLDNWIDLDKQNKLFDIPVRRNGFASRINIEELKKYIQANPDRYYRELAIEFKISKSQIHRLVHKLKFSVKKNELSTKNLT